MGHKLAQKKFSDFKKSNNYELSDNSDMIFENWCKDN